MTPLFEGFAAKYGWIIMGITFGFAAKYALLIKRGVRVRARLVFADLLLLPMVALLAYWLAARAGLGGETGAVVASFCAVGADRLIKLLTERFLQRVDNEARALAGEQMGLARQVVQTELSGERIIGDTIEGKAPPEYIALRPHPQAGKPGD